MVNNNEKPGYVARLIGYLSLCMLAAAFGSMFGDKLLVYWLIFGTFGLVSAIGLNMISQSRTRYKELNEKKKLLQQAEKNLNKIVEIEESFDAIADAVRHIQSDIEITQKHQAVTITPLNKSPGTTGEHFEGTLWNISTNGFSLAHDFCLQRGYVLLLFALENREPIQFIADLLWCERQTDGRYFSGGKFLELVASVDVGSEKTDFAETH